MNQYASRRRVVNLVAKIFCYGHDGDLFSLKHVRNLGSIGFASHAHRTYELSYLLQGERCYVLRNRVYPVRQNSLMFIAPREVHRVLAGVSVPYEKICINFRQTFVPNVESTIFRVFQRKPVLSLEAERQQYVEGILFEMLRECQHQPLGFALILQTLLMQLLVTLARSYSETTTKPSGRGVFTHGQVIDIIGYLRQSFSQPITLSNVANRFYVSPHYLSRVFKETTGVAFVRYVNQLRVEEAQRLLRLTDLHVERVGERAGFGSGNNFRRVFKQAVGVSPRAYRKRYQEVARLS